MNTNLQHLQARVDSELADPAKKDDPMVTESVKALAGTTQVVLPVTATLLFWLFKFGCTSACKTLKECFSTFQGVLDTETRSNRCFLRSRWTWKCWTR